VKHFAITYFIYDKRPKKSFFLKEKVISFWFLDRKERDGFPFSWE
jgi:hypothetical protein